jgi:hypothetical protein
VLVTSQNSQPNFGWGQHFYQQAILQQALYDGVSAISISV